MDVLFVPAEALCVLPAVVFVLLDVLLPEVLWIAETRLL